VGGDGGGTPQHLFLTGAGGGIRPGGGGGGVILFGADCEGGNIRGSSLHLSLEHQACREV